MMRVTALLLCSWSCAALTLQTEANPIRKVVTLLQDMQKEIEAEGEKEGVGVGLQDWGTAASDGYFKILRWKLRLMEIVLAASIDVLLLDIDVLPLTHKLLPTFVAPSERLDVIISSDERTKDIGMDCPLSRPFVLLLCTTETCTLRPHIQFPHHIRPRDRLLPDLGVVAVRQ